MILFQKGNFSRREGRIRVEPSLSEVEWKTTPATQARDDSGRKYRGTMILSKSKDKVRLKIDYLRIGEEVAFSKMKRKTRFTRVPKTFTLRLVKIEGRTSKERCLLDRQP